MRSGSSLLGLSSTATTAHTRTHTQSSTHLAQVLFRSLNRLLMDTAAHEYLFCLEMWVEEGVYRCVGGCRGNARRAQRSARPAAFSPARLCMQLCCVLGQRAGAGVLPDRRLPRGCTRAARRG